MHSAEVCITLAAVKQRGRALWCRGSSPSAPPCCGSCWVDGGSGSQSFVAAEREGRKHTPPAQTGEIWALKKAERNPNIHWFAASRTVISAVHWGQRCPLDVSTEWDLLMMDSSVCSSTSRRLSTIISTSSWTDDSWNTESEQKDVNQSVVDVNMRFHVAAGTQQRVSIFF